MSNYALPPGCRDSIKDNLPNSQTWQTCNTTGWLQDLVLANPLLFSNASSAFRNSGFVGAFSIASGQDVSCPYGQTCSVEPVYPPVDGTSDFNVQRSIVQLTIWYISSWYEAADQTLNKQQILSQSLVNEIVSQLVIPTPYPAYSNVKSILSLVGTIIGKIPYPPIAAVGGGINFFASLMPPPPDTDKIDIDNIVALDSLEATLSAKGGVAFDIANTQLNSRHAQLFNEPTDPISDVGMLTFLQDGAWFDYTHNVQNNNPTDNAEARSLTYSWIVSAVLQAQKTFLHAVIVPDCNGPLPGIQGNACINYQGTSIVLWPARWNLENLDNFDVGGGGLPSHGSSVQAVTRHPKGDLIMSKLVPDLDEKVDPHFMFTSSLLCQANATSNNTLLRAWPDPLLGRSSTFDAPNCLFNLPIIFQQDPTKNLVLPSTGDLALVQDPTSSCMDTMTEVSSSNDPVMVFYDANYCQEAWSLDAYAAIALGLSPDDNSRFFCSNVNTAIGWPSPPSCPVNGRTAPAPCAPYGSDTPDNGCVCLRHGDPLNFLEISAGNCDYGG